jgi:capsular exopolysaccharide synthesis family protein
MMSHNDFGKAISEIVQLENSQIIRLESIESDNDDEKSKVVVGTIDRKNIDERLIVYHNPRSIESEYFRFLKSRIEQQFERKRKIEGRVILITGPNLAAGKTICSINLALGFARSYGGKTLFMDTDTRRGTSRKYLGIREENLPGFSDVLTRKTRAGRVLLNTEMFNMVYFPSGEFSEQFLDELRGKELSVLINSLKERFKYIIIDSPPAFPMPETAAIAQHCDGVFVVLRADRDGQEDLIQAREALDGANIMGVILNAVKKTPGQRYGAYGYYGKRR